MTQLARFQLIHTSTRRHHDAAAVSSIDVTGNTKTLTKEPLILLIHFPINLGARMLQIRTLSPKVQIRSRAPASVESAPRWILMAVRFSALVWIFYQEFQSEPRWILMAVRFFRIGLDLAKNVNPKPCCCTMKERLIKTTSSANQLSCFKQLNKSNPMITSNAVILLLLTGSSLFETVNARLGFNDEQIRGGMADGTAQDVWSHGRRLAACGFDILQGYTCPSGQFCDKTSDLYVCKDKLESGKDCKDYGNIGCQSGLCTSGVCAECTLDSEDRVCTSSGKPYCDSTSYSCKKSLPNDAKCPKGDKSCASGRCDGWGSGTCQAKDGKGEWCNEDSDCINGDCAWSLWGPICN